MNEIRERRGFRSRGQIEGRQRRIHREVSAYCFFFLVREGRFLGEHRHRNTVRVEFAFRNHDEVARGVCHAKIVQRLHRNRNNSQRFAGLAEFPTGNG